MGLHGPETAAGPCCPGTRPATPSVSTRAPPKDLSHRDLSATLALTLRVQLMTHDQNAQVVHSLPMHTIWAPALMSCEAVGSAQPVIRSECLLVALNEYRQFHTGPDPVTDNQLWSA